MRNDLLAAIVSALNGSVTNMNDRNKLLADIVLALGGTVTNIDNRNMLLTDILNAIKGGVEVWYNPTTGLIYPDVLITNFEDPIQWQ